MPTWNLKDIYNIKDTQKLLKKLKTEVNAFKKYRKTLKTNPTPKKFIQILNHKEQILRLSTKLEAYASLWHAENTADSKRNAHESKISQIIAELGNEMMFFNLWFKELDNKTAQNYIKHGGEYAYILKRMRAFKPHTLKEKEEQIINLKDLSGSEALVKLYDITTNRFRFKWNTKVLSQEEVNQYKQNPKSELRKKAYDLVLSKYGKEEAVLGEIYKSLVMDWYNEEIKLRNFATPISVRNLVNNVPDKAVHALLKTVHKNGKIFRDYFKLKAKLLNIKKFTRYDVLAPYSSKSKKYPFDECKKITLETYKEFSPLAYKLAKKIFDEAHIHSDLTPNKQSGGFCSSVLPEITPYILTNHVGTLNDLSTLVHEVGHGIHSLAASHRNAFNFHAPLPLAETASIFGEMLLSSKLLREGSKQEKINILVKMLDGQYASIVRQAYFVLFEVQAHDAISKGAAVNDLNKIYLKNLKEQFGSSLSIDPVFQHEWKYIPHIYHTPFYCYAYAFGNLLVLALYNMYKKQGESFVPKYMKILAYGGSKEPAKILKEIGVDIEKESFWQKGFDIIKEEIKELKRLVK